MRIQALLLFSASLALSFMAAQVPARAGDLTNTASLNAKAPATYKVKFDTSKGGFMVQFGINGDPKLSQVWRDANIKDDPVKASNKRGNITFATAGRDTRTTQVFINFGNNAGLDDQGFAPFGQVISGMEVVDSLYGGYGEGAPQGHGPNQGVVQSMGNAYLEKEFAKLDYVKSATIEP